MPSDRSTEPTHQEQDFLARMSHELRTPLNAIQGYTDMLLEGKAPHHADHQDLVSIRRAAHRLLAMVESVLDLNQLRTGRFEVMIQPVELQPLLETVAEAIAEHARKNHTEVRLDVEPLTVRTDLRMLRQIVFNLAENAARFTHRGRVLLRLRALDATRFQLVVSDNGIGMTASQVDACTQPFWQADASSTRRYDGAGMGLAVCKGLAEALGGTLTVDSRIGHGAEVILTLPLESEPHSEWDDDEPTVLLR